MFFRESTNASPALALRLTVYQINSSALYA
jgi:hypothetical protein